MKQGLNTYRIIVLSSLFVVVVVLGGMTASLSSELRNLSRAAEDNLQWSITQIDTEFANLDATLTDQLATQSLADEAVQLRVDIALSRLNIINSGRSAELFDGSSEAKHLILPINAFADAAIRLSDAPGPLTGPALRDMHSLVQEVRPYVRNIALLGVRLGAEKSESRRAEFASQLSLTGGIAVALLILMAVLMLVFDGLLSRAADRDAALSASAQLLASTVKASLDAIVTANENGEIIDFNSSAERVFGWKRDEIVGQTMEDTFIPHRMRDAHHNGMQRYIKTGTPRVVDQGRVELAALRKSGEEFPVEINITSTQNGDTTTFIAYIRDISERKINEQKLIDARDRAERTDKAKSQFLTVMSHEMRTPLNGILGVLDLLKTTTLTRQQDRFAKIATSSSEILLEQVNEALDITRIETGKLHPTLQDFYLPDLMNGLKDMFDPLASEKKLFCTLEIEDAMHRHFHGDAGRIRQILTNLMGNAIKFTDTGGVHFKVRGIHGPETSSLRFEVQDTGIGIPADKQEQVFEDFFALGNSDVRQDRGDGLGLSISRRIARAMGGDVTLRTENKTGSTFILTLPLPRADRSEPSAPPEDPEIPRAVQACSILIVEDNTINRSVLSDMLISMGHHVQEAVNGADCLEKAERMTFDLIFMDIGMPIMNGVEATERLRADGGRNANTLIIGLTAHGREEFREQAVSAGMDRFHTKPIRMDTLHSIVAELTSGPLTKLDAAKFRGALREMVDVLGVEKVQNVADAFLAELTSLIADLRAGDDMPSTADLAETAHRVKGAASLLGLTFISDELTTLEDVSRAGTLNAPIEWADTLANSAAKSETIFENALKVETHRPKA